jgi:hypothetical protein
MIAMGMSLAHDTGRSKPRARHFSLLRTVAARLSELQGTVSALEAEQSQLRRRLGLTEASRRSSSPLSRYTNQELADAITELLDVTEHAHARRCGPACVSTP